MIACCIPMLLIAVALVADGVGSPAFILVEVVCTAIMALTMGGHVTRRRWPPLMDYPARHLNLGRAIGYNSLALPSAAVVFEPIGLARRPEIAAISMAGSSVLVAVNALARKRLRRSRTAGANG